MAGKPQERPNRAWSKRRLRNYQCAWCEQRLDRMVDGNNCGSLYQKPGEVCHWRTELGKSAHYQNEETK